MELRIRMKYCSLLTEVYNYINSSKFYRIKSIKLLRNRKVITVFWKFLNSFCSIIFHFWRMRHWIFVFWRKTILTHSKWFIFSIYLDFWLNPQMQGWLITLKSLQEHTTVCFYFPIYKWRSNRWVSVSSIGRSWLVQS